MSETGDDLSLLQDIQSRQVEMTQAVVTPRRRVFVWVGTIVALLGALLILLIQRDQQTGDLRALVVAAADRHGLDPDLVHAVVLAESRGNPRAYSRADAFGLMQLQIPTASEMSEMAGGEPVTREDLFKSATNLDLGCRYLVWLDKRFDGDLRLVLMAYNAGPGNVRKWQKQTKDVNVIVEKHAFAQTRAYVAKVLAYREALKEG
jgi:soluble lytic murein transglycosylase